MDKSRFIICRASAGSGKTYTLVRQYIELAFDAPEQELPRRFKSILAITFTNKAANEMKERILHDLSDMAAYGTASGIGQDIAQRLGLDDGTLRHYSGTLHSAIMHNYSDFGVCTIDSFVHRLVRTFAHDLKLPINFDLQIDQADLVQNAIERLTALIGTPGEEDLTKMLCEQAERNMNDNKSYLLDKWLEKQLVEVFKEQTPEYLGDLEKIGTARFRQMYGEMLQANKAYEKRMKALGEEGVKIYSDRGLNIADFYQGAKGAGRYFEKLAGGDLKAPNSYALGYLEEDKLGGGKCSNAKTDALADAKPHLQGLHRQIEELRQSEGVLYNSRRLLMGNLYTLAVLNRMNELMTQYARENDIVHISEFNKKISEVVQNEPQPFIYERIGSRYHNYLIDEFQDTSRLQWLNLVPLLSDGVGEGHTSMVVGDGKQAIYRFRQGDVEQFVALPRIEGTEHGGNLADLRVADVMPLYTNYRSMKEVVLFNNDFFAWLIPHHFGENQQLQDIYIGHGDRADKDPLPEGKDKPDLYQHHKKEGGYVQVGFWPEDKERGHDLLWEQMVADLRRLHDELGWRWQDITLLGRTKKVLAEIATYLKGEGIPMVSDESFLLSNSRTVMMMRYLLQYLRDGSDRVAAAQVVLCMQALGIAEAPTLDNLPDDIHPGLHCDHLRRLSLYDCCEEVLRGLQLNDIETAYADTFLNILSHYCTTHRQDIGEFVEWFDKNVEKWSVSTAGDLDAIRLMTIHKAKGLESPIVMMPLLGLEPKNDSIWVHIPADKGLPVPAAHVLPKKEEPTIFDNAYRQEQQKQETDKVNLLYVAFTRAKNQLYLYGLEPKNTESTDLSALVANYMTTRSDAIEVRSNVKALGTIEGRPSMAGKDNDKSQVELHSIPFPDWSNRIAIAQQSDHLFQSHDDTALRRGNQLHELLSLTHNRNENAAALEYYCRRNHIDNEEQECLGKILQEVTATGEAAHFFDPNHQCKNECSITWHGEILRPDRIVMTEDETWVVDFKTGQPHIEHQAQVLHYCEAIQAMGYPKVSGHLLYIGRNGQCSVQRV